MPELNRCGQACKSYVGSPIESHDGHDWIREGCPQVCSLLQVTQWDDPRTLESQEGRNIDQHGQRELVNMARIVHVLPLPPRHLSLLNSEFMP